MWTIRKARRRKTVDRMRDARLAKAETELLSLKTRAARAIVTLDERRDRNHWQESVARMIQGGL